MNIALRELQGFSREQALQMSIPDGVEAEWYRYPVGADLQIRFTWPVGGPRVYSIIGM